MAKDNDRPFERAEPYMGEEEGQEPYYGEDEASGKGKSTGQGRDTAIRTTEDTGTEAGMRPTGSGGSAPPNP